MIGRGVINPFIFHQIRAHFAKKPYRPQWDDLVRYLEVYISQIPPESSIRLKINKMKQLMGFLFKANAASMIQRQTMLTTTYTHFEEFLNFSPPLLKEGWETKRFD